MALFTLIGIDKPDAADLRALTRTEHLAYLEQHRAMVKLAGPFLNAEGQPTGSMLIIDAEDLQAAKAFQAGDPYAKALLFQSSDLRAWRVTIGELA